MKKIMIVFSLCFLAFSSVLLGKPSSVQAKDQNLSIAIVQLVSHPSLDQINQGIIDQLQSAGYQEGDNLQVDQVNAQGDLNLLQSMSQQVVSKKPDLIFAITTQVAQSLQAATSDIPIILAGVTDPVAAGLLDNLEHPGGNISGVSDLIPLEDHFKLMLAIDPSIKKLGLIYTTSDDSAKATLEKAQEAAQAVGIELVTEGISQALDLQMVAEKLAPQVDAFYVGADNTVAAAFDNLLTITDKAKLGIYPSIDQMVNQGGVAALAINQAEIGHLAADFALKVVDGQAIGDLPVAYLDHKEKIFNSKTLKLIGLELPKDQAQDFKDVAGD